MSITQAERDPAAVIEDLNFILDNGGQINDETARRLGFNTEGALYQFLRRERKKQGCSGV